MISQKVISRCRDGHIAWYSRQYYSCLSSFDDFRSFGLAAFSLVWYTNRLRCPGVTIRLVKFSSRMAAHFVFWGVQFVTVNAQLFWLSARMAHPEMHQLEWRFIVYYWHLFCALARDGRVRVGRFFYLILDPSCENCESEFVGCSLSHSGHGWYVWICLSSYLFNCMERCLSERWPW